GTSVPSPAVTVASNVLANDTTVTDTSSIASHTNPSNGSLLAFNADGTFTYLPNAGFSGTDTFPYTLRNHTDATLTCVGAVTITVGTVVWYVDNSKPAGDGRSNA